MDTPPCRTVTLCTDPPSPCRSFSVGGAGSKVGGMQWRSPFIPLCGCLWNGIQEATLGSKPSLGLGRAWKDKAVTDTTGSTGDRSYMLEKGGPEAGESKVLRLRLEPTRA
ncbi:hypothetical protein DR999_PMT03593 [Platysternon megacephalum]|uniref:Uncharacterized protein n=1 Tax=Platysternon megacephalum TaxID=55544 RepID=A0A4D9EQU0_9SAUR|nr:hypothetical protein DR999_PMT03593 [Platysternon megacephalum]